ncbi:unannotated protein [freshwater metagenome]|uniref:Unannotated protein n=1 Tax=freshwater metagenome TaxID=449393 RepID=A0A6J7EV27_9ZZZZ|nr:DUF333 domain-containing protein [Actinomycetota bacterium]
MAICPFEPNAAQAPTLRRLGTFGASTQLTCRLSSATFTVSSPSRIRSPQIRHVVTASPASRPILCAPTGRLSTVADSEPADTTTPTGIANPASVFCVKQGGRLEIVDEAGGQVGYCNLPDGTRVEEWEYFRAQTGTTSVP